MGLLLGATNMVSGEPQRVIEKEKKPTQFSPSNMVVNNENKLFLKYESILKMGICPLLCEFTRENMSL